MFEGVQDICWSPIENVLAVYQGEHANLPARVALMLLPERKELRQKNLFAVVSAKFFWHPQGTYLAVLVRFCTCYDQAFVTVATHNMARYTWTCKVNLCAQNVCVQDLNFMYVGPGVYACMM